MHPAWAGAGGNWPAIDEAIDEAIDARVIRQESEFSCAAACAEMLLREQGIGDRSLLGHRTILCRFAQKPGFFKCWVSRTSYRRNPVS